MCCAMADFPVYPLLQASFCSLTPVYIQKSTIHKIYHTGKGSGTARLPTVQLDRDSIGSGLMIYARTYLFCKGSFKKWSFYYRNVSSVLFW